MKLDLMDDNIIEATKRPRSWDEKRKGVAIYNVASDKFLCREFIPDTECGDPNCRDVDFMWDENNIWLIDDDTFSQIATNVARRSNKEPVHREVAIAKRSVTDFLWEWAGDCVVVDCVCLRVIVHNRRGIIYGLGQLLRGKGYPSSELIPETQDEVYIDVDHIHTTPVLSLRDET